MKLLEPGDERRNAASALIQYLFDNAVEIHETHHLKARFTPIGTDEGRVVVLVEEPELPDRTIRIPPYELTEGELTPASDPA
jgi:hypothetical protein